MVAIQLAYLVTEDSLCKFIQSLSVHIEINIYAFLCQNAKFSKTKYICIDLICEGMTYERFLSFRSVGNATAAFVLAVLEGSTQPGVWFPEEVCTIFK